MRQHQSIDAGLLRHPAAFPRMHVHRSRFRGRERAVQHGHVGFMAEAHNVILVGGTGTGKTHLEDIRHTLCL